MRAAPVVSLWAPVMHAHLKSSLPSATAATSLTNVHESMALLLISLQSVMHPFLSLSWGVLVSVDFLHDPSLGMHLDFAPTFALQATKSQFAIRAGLPPSSVHCFLTSSTLAW